MEGKNKYTQEEFLKAENHPRKKELIQMLFDGKTIDELEAASFNRVAVLEMARKIHHNVQGFENFTIDYPRNPEKVDGSKAFQLRETAQPASQDDEANESSETSAPEDTKTDEAVETNDTAADVANETEVANQDGETNTETETEVENTEVEGEGTAAASEVASESVEGEVKTEEVNQG